MIVLQPSLLKAIEGHSRFFHLAELNVTKENKFNQVQTFLLELLCSSHCAVPSQAALPCCASRALPVCGAQSPRKKGAKPRWSGFQPPVPLPVQDQAGIPQLSFVFVQV